MASYEDIKGCYRDALRRAKSFKKTKRKGQAGKDRSEIKGITLIYSDSRDWRYPQMGGAWRSPRQSPMGCR